ncbi:MAG TPA: hypothetical protein PKZ43_06530 [Bacteroidales bacterium]|nr:hypothetical protein [Bacteroidales bacterium]HPS45793.1 hypothetical protein [Bacteroidales bacterium]HQH19192.1 hypothetical protein [Bacteroidales bacterium]HQI44569.1 hypothetical protein [Bacteroidales bacterium]
MAKLNFRKRKEKVATPETLITETVKIVPEVSDEEAAAISLALHLYVQDVHDYERTIITIQKVMRPYSPWSSKIYGLRQIPIRFPRHLK